MWNQLLCKHDILTLCVLVTVLADAASGSTIQFHASPTQIQYPVTSSLSMRCGLAADDPAVTSVTPTPGSGLVGKRSAGGTDPIQHVYSMTIYRDEVRVATVSPFTAPQVETKEDLANVKVTGDVTGTDAEKGYLELTWSFPTSTQTGHYKCLVDGVTSRGHSDRLSAVLDVEAAEITFQDLAKEMSAMKATIVELEDKVKDHQTQLQKAMTEALHIESGLLDCGNSGHWTHTSRNGELTGMHYNLYKPLSQSFKTQYTTPPVVFLSLRHVHVQHGKYSVYGFVLRNVTSSGFDMMCESAAGSSFQLNDLEVSWLSVGAA